MHVVTIPVSPGRDAAAMALNDLLLRSTAAYLFQMHRPALPVLGAVIPYRY